MKITTFQAELVTFITKNVRERYRRFSGIIKINFLWTAGFMATGISVVVAVVLYL